MISYDEAKEMFSYDSNTGEIRRKKNSSVRHLNKGEIATFNHKASEKYSRLHVSYKGKRYLAHRIAWLLHYKEMPSGMIDHINGNPLDNRIDNLRIATSRENQLNRVRGTSLYKTSKYGIAGLTYSRYKKTKKWRVRAFADGRTIQIGYFETMLDACCEIMKRKAG